MIDCNKILSFFFVANADPSLYYNGYYEASSNGGGHSAAQYTWLIALLGSLAFMLILVSFVMIYYRKKPKHYLAANTSGKVDEKLSGLRYLKVLPFFLDKIVHPKVL